MRLGSVLSEALRNIGSGVSRAFAMFLAVLLSGTLLGGYEAMTVIDLESQAVQRINAYVDVNAIVGGNGGWHRMRPVVRRRRWNDGNLGWCDACRRTGRATRDTRQGHLIV